MKKIFALIIAAVILMTAPMALAQGNVTIALQGQNEFDDHIYSMIIRDGQLLLFSYANMYTWTPETGELVKVEGYEELGDRLTGNAETPGLITLEEGQYAYLLSDVYVVNDRIYRMAQISGDDNYSILVELKIGEDGAVSFADTIDLGDAMLIDYGDGYTSMRSLNNACGIDGKLIGLSYGENGSEILSIDLENAEVNVMNMDLEAEVQSISLYTEGKLLMVTQDYSQDPVVSALYVYDTQSEESTLLGTLPIEGWASPSGIVYDEARAQIYYAMNGAVYRMPVSESGLGEPVAFGDMPLEVYSDATGVLLGDLYIARSYEGVVGRDVTIEKMAEEQLRVENSSYIDAVRKAYYPFTDKHPEYAVNIGSGDTGTILSDMMNRDSSVDIYTMSLSESAFGALLDRGFLAELGGSQVLMEHANSLYPVILNKVMKDGQLYALPLETYGSSGISINMALLQDKFGMNIAAPTSWMDLFALIAELSTGKMEEVPEVSLFEPYYTVENARSSLFYNMLSDYFLWMDHSEENLARAGEVLIALCEAFEAIDWNNLALPEEFDDENGWSYNPENIILSTVSIDLSSYLEEGHQELLLAIEQGGTPLFGVNVSVAFVNPFSEHREEAIEFLEYALGNAAKRNLIAMSPDKNDPIENSYYEESMKNIAKNIAEIEKTIEGTEDEEQREMLLADLDSIKQWQEEYEQTGRYDVSAEDIERYRGYAQNMSVTRSNLWSSDSGEQVMQYMDGAITKEQLATALQKTLQMQRLEGN